MYASYRVEAMQRLRKSLQKWCSLQRQQPPVVSVRADLHRVTINSSSADEPLVFAWNEVQEIHAYKVDLLTVDDIRLAFRTARGWCEVSEDDDGFTGLVETMQRLFPTVREDWLEDVAYSAFASNERVLWKQT